jgi:hypothetical protein
MELPLMIPFTRSAYAVGLLALFSLGGCGPRYEWAETVEGTLSVDGKPVAEAHVEFVPEADSRAPHSSGVTDEKGFFRLVRNDDNKLPGAVVGPHRVLVFPGRPAGARNREQPDSGKTDSGKTGRTTVPPIYMTADKTPLKVEVKKDQTTYDLQISPSAR